MTFEKVGEDLPPLWGPNEGDSIKGIYRGVQHNVGKNKSDMYTIEVDGELNNFWGSTVLDKKMMCVKVDDNIRITYEGKDAEKDYKKYSVEVDKPEDEDKEITEELEADAEEDKEIAEEAEEEAKAESEAKDSE